MTGGDAGWSGRDEAGQRPRTIGFLLIPEFGLLAYASAIEPLRAANALSGRELYRWRHLSPDGGAVAASNGVRIVPDVRLEDARRELDALLVCAGGNPAAFRDAATFEHLRRFARLKRPIGGVAGGPYVLARAGLLRGYHFTLHWEYARALAEEFPDLDLRRTLFEVDRGLLTSSGGTAALDMMHAFLAREHGAELAMRVSEWFLQTDIRETGHPQRMALAERLGVRSEPTLKAVGCMEANIEAPVSRAALAACAGVSPRQLERLFRLHLGCTPGAYYSRLRLSQARLLIRQSALPVLEVASACGFASASHFSRAYRRAFGRSPVRERAGRATVSLRSAVMSPAVMSGEAGAVRVGA
ncbi:MAG TPA: GlxA family transcriptional regulator [Acetobacteraceae bacterium]|nr:GlxA family transcriptional regulator [Acetobacteraceae bacterium]